MRVRCDLAYDGTAFAGWARQPGLRTVQGVLEDALALVCHGTGVAPHLTVAGRTDAGVHATSQVAHADIPDAVFARLAARGAGDGPAALGRRLGAILHRADTDVVVRQVRAVPDAFDARFSALWRRYTYRIADEAAERDPLRRHDTVWLPGILDVAAMDEAAGAMLGLHDFAAFCKARPEATTIRTLQVFRWQRELDGVLVATVQADAFCHSMVRALVGALAALGRGRPVDPVALLRDPSGPRGYTVLAPHGLVLVAVGYPDDAGLAARAAQTRARRDREPGMCEPGGGVS